MALTEERKASLLAYCRIEKPTDEELLTLETLYHAAVGYLEHAGVLEPPDGTTRRAQYDLCVNAMVRDVYDRRGAQTEGSVGDNPMLRRMITQLKLTEVPV